MTAKEFHLAPGDKKKTAINEIISNVEGSLCYADPIVLRLISWQPGTYAIQGHLT